LLGGFIHVGYQVVKAFVFYLIGIEGQSFLADELTGNFGNLGYLA
jgi:hypothetical protein